MNNTPKVTVLISTYNGAKYLKDQLESVLNQDKVKTNLIIRDDGSVDNTISIIKDIVDKYPNRIELYRGENKGPALSYLSLCRIAESSPSDWYAFCDQDDVWLPEKLARAISLLNKVKDNRGNLYVSSTTLCDANLHVIGENRFINLRFSLGAELSRHRLPGHVMVFDKKLLHELNQMKRDYSFPHDHLLCVVACAIGARFVFDKKSLVLHRRLTSSVTAGGNGIKKRIRHEIGLIRNHSKINRHELANEILNRYRNILSKDDINLLTDVKARNKINLIKDVLTGKLSAGIPFENVETIISILGSNY